MPRKRRKKNFYDPKKTGPSGHRKVRINQQSETEQRAALEQKWFPAIDFAREMASLVINKAAENNPYHRWLPYRQGFSPELVRKFIEAERSNKSSVILDPFSGSGTTSIECSKAGIKNIGIEALGSLAFITMTCVESAIYPDIKDPESFLDIKEYYNNSENILSKVAALTAISELYKGDGQLKKNPGNPEDILKTKIEMINEDKQKNISGHTQIIQGDARNMPLADNCINGIITSPPYLSKYDYSRVNAGIEELYSENKNKAKDVQVRAHHKAHKRKWQNPAHPAGEEACKKLVKDGKPKLAGIVRSYLDDMQQVVSECARILKDGGCLTMAVAGALFNGVYIPSDLIIAEFCGSCGLEVEEILMVRTFGAPKKLGTLDHISPREVILSARKA